MSSLLQIEVSPGGDHSVSRQISGEFVTAWKAAHADGTVILKDLATNPVPHLDGEAIFAGYTPEGSRSEAMIAKHHYRQELIKEITSVDEILISTPMWNWSAPSVLKAYFDQIIIPGQLDGSGADGLKGKKVTFIVSQGGSYAEGVPRHGWDYETGYLELVATALGSTDVEIILAELTLAGVVPGMESLVEKKKASIAAAIAQPRSALPNRFAICFEEIIKGTPPISRGRSFNGWWPKALLAPKKPPFSLKRIREMNALL